MPVLLVYCLNPPAGIFPAACRYKAETASPGSYPLSCNGAIDLKGKAIITTKKKVSIFLNPVQKSAKETVCSWIYFFPFAKGVRGFVRSIIADPANRRPPLRN